MTLTEQTEGSNDFKKIKKRSNKLNGINSFLMDPIPRNSLAISHPLRQI